MTVEQLIEELQQFPPCTEVRLAQQPSWPFKYAIQGLVGVDEFDEGDDRTMPTVVYIVEGRQLGYLPKQAADEIGW